MPSKRRSLLAASGGGAPTGQLWSVGTGTYGQTAQGNTTNISYPVQVGALGLVRLELLRQTARYGCGEETPREA